MLRFVHISDTHIGPNRQFELYGHNTYDNALHLINSINHDLGYVPDFVVHTGDVTNDHDAESARLAAQLFADLRFPIHYVRGNHDDPAFMRQYLLKQAPDDGPLYYDFVQGNVEFLVLDTRGEIDPQGYIDAAQLAWLAEKMSASMAERVVLLIHHQPLKLGVPWLDRDMRVMNDDALFDVLRPHKNQIAGIFFGHIHRPLTALRDGILCSAAASSFALFYAGPHDDKPRFDTMAQAGYAIVTLDGEQTTVTHHTLPRP